ncbi:MAG: hypothetical protein C4522_11095 [Desulfobacteraceae bacterium]|nr:MAG: hypothetical protein C4522_11095 [Desulfobacteraceae bacterium]
MKWISTLFFGLDFPGRFFPAKSGFSEVVKNKFLDTFREIDDNHFDTDRFEPRLVENGRLFQKRFIRRGLWRKPIKY